jgi:hypothetical protein
MDRVLKRQKLDAEGQANIVLLQDDAQQQMRPRQLFSSGYPGLIHRRKSNLVILFNLCYFFVKQYFSLYPLRQDWLAISLYQRLAAPDLG